MSTEEDSYILENISNSRAIYKSLYEFDERILKRIHKAIDENLEENLSEFQVYEQDNLYEDYMIVVAHNDWFINRDRVKEPVVFLYFELEGNNPIWKLFGENGLEDDDLVNVGMVYRDLSFFENGEELVKEFVTKFEKQIREKGYKYSNAKTNRYFELPLELSPLEIVSALKTNDWDSALNPLFKKWNTILSTVDINLISKIVRKGKLAKA